MSGTAHARRQDRHRQRRFERLSSSAARDQRAAEVVESMVADLDPNQPTTEPLADWEYELLYGGHGYHETDVRHEMDADGVRTWTIGEPVQTEVYDDDDGYQPGDWRYPDLEAEDDETFWLPLMSISDLCNELGPDGWHIERRGYSAPSKTSQGYLRVYELAQAAHVPSRTVLDILSDCGEFTVNHLSRVALPMVDQVNSIITHKRLTGEIDPPTPPTMTLDALRRSFA